MANRLRVHHLINIHSGGIFSMGCLRFYDQRKEMGFLHCSHIELVTCQTCIKADNRRLNKVKKTENLEAIYARHNEPVSSDGFNRRDFIIFQTAIGHELKKISKLADKERQHFGKGNFSELEDYMEHLERKIGAALSDTVMVQS